MEVFPGVSMDPDVRFGKPCLSGTRIDVAFIGWIRSEQRFESLEALVRRMDEDSVRAREALARAGNAFPPI